MSNCFNGAALYTKEEIGKALSAYENAIKTRQDLINIKVKQAEENFTPSWWDKFNKIVTLKDKYRRWRKSGSFRWMNYESWCNDARLLKWTKEEGEWLEELSIYTYEYHAFNRWVYSDISQEVKDLYNGGKDCYLNPDQARFVNEFKNYGEQYELDI